MKGNVLGKVSCSFVGVKVIVWKVSRDIPL